MNLSVLYPLLLSSVLVLPIPHEGPPTLRRYDPVDSQFPHFDPPHDYYNDYGKLAIVEGRIQNSISLCAKAGCGALSAVSEEEINQYEANDCFALTKGKFIPVQDQEPPVTGSIKVENGGLQKDHANNDCASAYALASANVENALSFFSGYSYYEDPLDGWVTAPSNNIFINHMNYFNLNTSATGGGCMPWNFNCSSAAGGNFSSDQSTSVDFYVSDSYSSYLDTITMNFKATLPADALNSNYEVKMGYSVVSIDGDILASGELSNVPDSSTMISGQVELKKHTLYNLQVWSQCNASAGVLISCGTQQDNKTSNASIQFTAHFD